MVINNNHDNEGLIPTGIYALKYNSYVKGLLGT